MADGCPIVFDCGTRVIKAGFASEDAPRVVFRAIVGNPRNAPKFGKRNGFAGDDVKSRLDKLIPSYPIVRGMITSWDNIVDLWRHTYTKLGVEPEDHPILLSEASLNPHSNRQRMTEVFFEELNVQAMYIAMEPILSLYGSCRRTGVVLECGEGTTQVVPIYEGRFLQHGMNRIRVAGQDLSEHLRKILMVEDGYRTQDPDVIYDIKEKIGYVAMDYEKEKAEGCSSPKSYQLPDGQVIDFGAEIVSCPEVHFQPLNLIGVDVPGVHELVFNSIRKCKGDLQKNMYENILISGRSSMFPGFADRLKEEISKLCSSSMHVNVIAQPGREYGVWTGGSILASLNNFRKIWISKEDYNEIGPTVVNKKCF